MNPWHNAWNCSMEIATGAPQVISHRVGMMHPAAWSATAAAEFQQMVVEKMEAAAESWSVLVQAALSPVPMADHPLAWWGAGLFQVSVLSCAVVFLLERFLQI